MKCLILFIVFTGFAFAQPDSLVEALKYYPLKTGNYWEYKEYFWQFPFPADSSAYSILIVGDTILPNNYKYKIRLREEIPENGYTLNIYERVDSLTGCVYRYSGDTLFNNSEYLIDSLLAQPGDYFTGGRFGNGSSGIQLSSYCVSEYKDTVLGLITDVKELEDQSMIPLVNYYLARNLGFIHSVACEFGCGNTNLVYALIDSNEYGRRITKVEKEKLAPPRKYILYQNFPNPFNPSTVISYYLPEESNVKLLIYDLKGELIQTLVNENLIYGIHKINFDASDYSSGLYFYILQTNEVILSKKMLLIK